MLDFTTKSSAFSFISYSKSLEILHARVKFFKIAGKVALFCTRKRGVKMSTITEKKKDGKVVAYKFTTGITAMRESHGRLADLLRASAIM